MLQYVQSDNTNRPCRKHGTHATTLASAWCTMFDTRACGQGHHVTLHFSLHFSTGSATNYMVATTCKATLVVLELFDVAVLQRNMGPHCRELRLPACQIRARLQPKQPHPLVRRRNRTGRSMACSDHVMSCQCNRQQSARASRQWTRLQHAVGSAAGQGAAQHTSSSWRRLAISCHCRSAPASAPATSCPLLQVSNTKCPGAGPSTDCCGGRAAALPKPLEAAVGDPEAGCCGMARAAAGL